jgi:two-component system sensor histidine kinase/response regulator
MTIGNEMVLLVDDDPRNVRLLEGIFRAGGYRVAKAYAGEEALELTAKDPPDLILLDVMMPHMSGHEVCARLKADPRTRPIPVILVTALNALEDKVLGLDTGADDFVSKPVNRIELLAKARSLLRVKAMHDDLAAAKAELEAKNEALLRLERMKESLTQMIVHDLKNPLTAIQGNLELIRLAPKDPEKVADRVTRALDSSGSMMLMILNLLDIGRMEENRLPLQPCSFDPRSIFAECEAEVTGLLNRGGIRIERDAEGSGDPVQLAADRGVVGRIVSNLVSNAIRHTPSGGTIFLRAVSDGENVEITVDDTGEGIPAENLPYLFEKFGRLHLKREGSVIDRGLGLAFCKLAAEAHGGKISVESEPGKGTKFVVSLPCQPPPAAEGSPAPDAVAQEGLPAVSPAGAAPR